MKYAIIIFLVLLGLMLFVIIRDKIFSWVMSQPLWKRFIIAIVILAAACLALGIWLEKAGIK